MMSLEEQLQALTITVKKLQRKVDSLHELDRNIVEYRPDTEVLMPRHDPSYEELFNVASTRSDMKRQAAPLTPRETQILNYVADGNTNKQIAYILRNSEQTIKNHVSAILHKLNANDRAHAVAIAMCHGWLSLKGNHEDIEAYARAI